MADFLIKHLKKKGEEHSALATLVNQWGFDEKVIPKALQAVGNLFPHYSRHDESHSRQILVNIERLLGENIELLTATDTWLILESAFWHDIGMVVSQEDIDQTVRSEEFLHFLVRIQESPDHELARFAKYFNCEDLNSCFLGADSPMEAVERFRQLFAEWFRIQHASRASEIVLAPWESLGITSPRTELIPDRLFRQIGAICHMHGMVFERLMDSTFLPYRQAGMAQEDCHPRFVAALLRLADLLDLDNNRFCPIMQKISGLYTLQSTRAHEDKHLATRFLRIDREKIEISAECETIDGYLATFQWFDWIKDEIRNQMSHWQEIVPNRRLGLLPTLGELEVRLSGELQVLSEGRRPQFTLDDQKVMEMLQGNNLYNSKFACIRELLQNAVDATLVQLWISRKNQNSTCFDNPFSQESMELKNSSKVTIELTEDSTQPFDDKTRWKLSVVDHGTGISRLDLQFMLQIGGSQRNVFRQSQMKDMPEWMKPAGAFGIGFQSAFMLSDKVLIKTKSAFTSERLELTMHSPTGKHSGLIVIRKLEDDYSEPPGTKLEMLFELDKISKRYSRKLGYDDSFAERVVQIMDPVLDDKFSYEAAELADSIVKFTECSPVPIDGVIRLHGIEKAGLGADDSNVNAARKPWNFVKTSQHLIAMQYFPITPCNISVTPQQGRYRGQTFKWREYLFPHCHVSFDILSGRADEWLNTSRLELAAGAEGLLRETLFTALEIQIKDDLKSMDRCPLLTEEKKPLYSLFLEAMAIDFPNSDYRKLADKLDGYWLELKPEGFEKTFREILSVDELILGNADYGDNVHECHLILKSSGFDLTLQIILDYWKRQGNSVQVIAPPKEREGANTASLSNVQLRNLKYSNRYHLKKVSQPLYTESALAAAIGTLLWQTHQNERVFVSLEPTLNLGSTNLVLKNTNCINARPLFDALPDTDQNILLPYLFRDSTNKRTKHSIVDLTRLDELCALIAPLLLVEISPEVIREEYVRLDRRIDEIMKNSAFSDNWQAARDEENN